MKTYNSYICELYIYVYVFNMAWGMAFKAEETAKAKVLRQEHA